MHLLFTRNEKYIINHYISFKLPFTDIYIHTLMCIIAKFTVTQFGYTHVHIYSNTFEWLHARYTVIL